MVSTTGKSGGGKKNLNFDLNLVPFIDILATCICFLLMTAVFMSLGTVNVKQAIGDGPALGNEKDPAMLWLMLSDDGDVRFTLKNVKTRGRAAEFTVQGFKEKNIDWRKTDELVRSVQREYPQIQTALIMPAAASRYQDLIRLMDSVRTGNMKNVGIAPL